MNTEAKQSIKKTFDDLPIATYGNIECVDGDERQKDVFLFAISTCQWCNKAKRYLNQQNYHYRYIDIDKIPKDQKQELKQELREIFGVKRIAFPFLVVDSVHYHKGWDPEVYKDLLSL